MAIIKEELVMRLKVVIRPKRACFQFKLIVPVLKVLNWIVPIEIQGKAE